MGFPLVFSWGEEVDGGRNINDFDDKEYELNLKCLIHLLEDFKCSVLFSVAPDVTTLTIITDH